MGEGRVQSSSTGDRRSRGIRAAVALTVGLGLAASMGTASGAVEPTVMISAPVHVKAKRAFAYNVTATDPNPGALLDLFVRPGTAPCAQTADVQAHQAQTIINEQPVNGTLSLTKRIKPVRGASRFCAYVHLGARTTLPEATATTVFFAHRRHRR